MNKIKIIADQRETRSGVIKSLDLMADVEVELVTLEVSDYVLSNRVGVERKQVDDFLKSWLDEKKLFGQIMDVCLAYEKPLLIIEGGLDSLFTSRNVHPNAVQGALNTIAVSFRCPTLYTLNSSETAQVLKAIATKEQSEDKRSFSPHGKRSQLSPRGKKEYVISSFPDCNVGAKTAADLLTHFGNIEHVVTASTEELQECPGVGKITAAKLRGLILEKY